MLRLHQGDLWAFACLTCGYLELHVLDAGTMAFIAHNWPPVPPVDEPVMEPIVESGS
jgi:hypothetical protein